MTEPKRIPASNQSLPERLSDSQMLAKNARFYATLFAKYQWETPQLSTGVFVQTLNQIADAIERQQAERDEPFFVEGVGFRSPDEAVMHLLAERAQTKAELERLRGHSEKFEKQRDSYKVQLDQVAQAVYPNKTDRFTYSVDFIIEEIKRLRGELKEKETK